MTKTPFKAIRAEVTSELIRQAIKAGWPAERVEELRRSLLATSAKRADNALQAWKTR
jgi:hypothetical protein